ncbi:hypothetical protein QJS66_22950 [Kocuria rhizophila]|nr:hypothetical protein QJS66_22950 [Kocuria rhizophila]
MLGKVGPQTLRVRRGQGDLGPRPSGPQCPRSLPPVAEQGHGAPGQGPARHRQLVQGAKGHRGGLQTPPPR